MTGTNPAGARTTIRRLTAVFLAVLLSPLLAHALTATPAEILANPDRFDRQTVTLSGTITNLGQTVSRRGNPYYTFDLSDGRQAIRVFSFGTAPCRSGGATVDGVFEKVKRVSGRTFYSEVTASRVTCR